MEIHLFTFIRPMPNSVYNLLNPLEVRYLTRLRIGFIHLKEHELNITFQDSIDSCAAVELKQQFISFSFAQILISKTIPL